MKQLLIISSIVASMSFSNLALATPGFETTSELSTNYNITVWGGFQNTAYKIQAYDIDGNKLGPAQEICTPDKADSSWCSGTFTYSVVNHKEGNYAQITAGNAKSPNYTMEYLLNLDKPEEKPSICEHYQDFIEGAQYEPGDTVVYKNLIYVSTRWTDGDKTPDTPYSGWEFVSRC